MIQRDNPQYKEKRIYKVILIVLIGMAVVSGAWKDLNQLMTFANEAQAFADHWFGGILPTVHAGTTESCTTVVKVSKVSRSDDFRWTGIISEGKSIEIKGISGSISAEPASGKQVEVVATKSARRSDMDEVKVEFVEHAGGVTICAVYPTDTPGVTNTCEPGTGSGRNQSVRNNDVRVDFKVRVPANVGFIGRTVNGEITAASLSSNVITHTVNGSIRISTSGYAQAKTVNGEIVASLGNGNWENTLEFKTLNGDITLDLPASVGAKVSAETFNGQISSDFPMSVLGTMSRKQISGTIGSGGRELLLKTLNGSINIRRAG